MKSCVGSTWCRYGVQDSVGLAILLEERYRGLRSPHKIKMAVSGCIRECAEARSKDVGVIATEKGWNLYVGGNGGSRPRHADLFAEDLDDDQLVAVIDRFLMYYVRTAIASNGRRRGSSGSGLDHVRDVVFDDTAGAGRRAGRGHGAATSTPTSASGRRRSTIPLGSPTSSSFVNAPDVATTPVWVTERGQRVPA